MPALVISGAAAVAATEQLGADHPDNGLVCDDGLSCGLPAVAGAELVESGSEVHIEAVYLTEVGYRQLDTALVGDPQIGHIAGDGVEGSNLDGVIG